MAHAFRQGDHICSIYDTEEEQLTTAEAYLADGLARGERCLYVGATRAALQRFDVALQAAGLDAAALMERGVLIELTHAEGHLIDGRFDCERMLRMLDDMVGRAIADGFPAMRACGDMSWLLLEAPGSAEVGEYEARLNRFFATTRSAAMCQYNRQRLPPPLIDMALATHSTAVVAGHHKFNPFFQAGRDATPGG
jgi:MEDS: MEthanogen/methylotroph, DcmR Sensory domain